jgi:hypothetical protein
VCDGSPPFLNVVRRRRWGERVRERGGSAPFRPCVVGRLGVFREQIADGDWLITGRTEPAHANAAAELSAFAAILVPEVTAVALGALIDGHRSWSVRWYGRKRSRMSTPPGGLTVSWRAKALTPNRLERGAAQRAGHRLAFVTQRCFRQHGQPPQRVGPVAAHPCPPSPGPA